MEFFKKAWNLLSHGDTAWSLWGKASTVWALVGAMILSAWTYLESLPGLVIAYGFILAFAVLLLIIRIGVWIYQLIFHNKIIPAVDSSAGKFNVIGLRLERNNVPNWPSDTVATRKFINIEVKAELADLHGCKVYLTSAEKIGESGQTEITAIIPNDKPVELRWFGANVKVGNIPEETVAKFTLLRSNRNIERREYLCFWSQPAFPIEYPPTLEHFFDEILSRYRIGLRLTAENAETINFFVEFKLRHLEKFEISKIAYF